MLPPVLQTLLVTLIISRSDAFMIRHHQDDVPRSSSSSSSSAPRGAPSSRLFATSQPPPQKLSIAQELRRRELLERRGGPYFQLNRFQGAVEFGSSAQLVTTLVSQGQPPNPEGIAEWLSDGRGLAMSIWDESMMVDLGNSLYRLQTMKLQFITIQLAPSVDVQMWTTTTTTTNPTTTTTTTTAPGSSSPPPPSPVDLPVFALQSVDFDPNIQLLPGVGIGKNSAAANSLGIQIDVVGELRPTSDGKGVTGRISFATKGVLPPPLRILPEGPLKMASDTINETIVSFAVESFQKGAIRKYNEFIQQQQQQQQ